MRSVRTIQKIVVGAIVLGNVALWSRHSDVVKYIASDRPLVFARYSLDRFNTMMIVLVLSCVAVYLVWANRKTIKYRMFMVIGVILALIVGFGGMDVLLRWIRVPSPFSTQQSGFQITDNTYQVIITDVPRAVRQYPRPAPGFPPIECTMTLDRRGFRNRIASDHYDIIALGDSFTEGFYVSDEHSWPEALSATIGRPVYNLGISGAGPLEYLLAFNRIGQFLKPEIVICMFTEISDFKYGASDEQLMKFRVHLSATHMAAHRRDLEFRKSSPLDRWRAYFRHSPIMILAANFCKQELTRIQLLGDVEGMNIISWVPVQVPSGNGFPHYNFSPVQLMDFYVTEEDFLASPGWRTAIFAIQEIQQACQQAKIRFIVAYAPSKIHVTLPLAKNQLPQDDVAAFAALEYRSRLPSSAIFLNTLLSRIEVQEAALARFCEENAIEFISTTRRLRDTIARGEQAYFTYDIHWTPVGHRVAADVIHRRLIANPRPES